jgi:hypothetical protein|tara:strand:- start:384 stop:869 length:486 start_codon:yes stop_codon:yes gene_type:complete
VIYCNVTDCSNWEELDEPVQRKRKPGFVPIGDMDQYRGTCRKNGMVIQKDNSISLSGIKKFLEICDSYNKNEDADGIVCFENRCLFNKENTCELSNIYVDNTEYYDRLEKHKIPTCRSFSNRKHKDAVDWRRIAEGGYGMMSNAPDSWSGRSSSGPRKYSV